MGDGEIKQAGSLTVERFARGSYGKLSFWPLVARIGELLNPKEPGPACSSD